MELTDGSTTGALCSVRIDQVLLKAKCRVTVSQRSPKTANRPMMTIVFGYSPLNLKCHPTSVFNHNLVVPFFI